MKQFYILLAIFSISFGIQPCISQTLEERDIREIKSKSRMIVKEFEGLLNLISNDQMYDTEIEAIIQNSLDENNGNKLFKNHQVIVEDDINPDLIARRRNTEIGSYLSNFNLQYTKTSDFSVSFENIELSDVYFKDHYFIIATIDRIFKSTYGREVKSYEPVQRALELEVFRNASGKWTATISSIIAFEPSLFQQLAYAKVDVLPSSNPILSFASELDLANPETEITNLGVDTGYDAHYYAIVRDAEKAFNEERYDDAILLFEEAKSIKSYDSYNTLMLGRSKRLYEVQKLNTKDDLINLYFNQANKANAKGELEIALGRNKRIRSLSDDKTAEKNIEYLEKRLKAKEDVEFLLTLNPDKKLLKEMTKKSKGKTKSVEYELGIALVMRKMYEQSRNPKEIKPILEPLNAVLKKEPEFTRARMERAEIYSYLADYSNAIKDFTYLISKNKNEYLFYIERGKRYLYAHDQEAAIADFMEATEINPTAPEGHFELGKIYMNSYAFEDVEYHFKQCINAQYSNPTYHYFYATAIKNDNLLKALDHLKIAQELDTDTRLAMQIERELSSIMQFAEAYSQKDSLYFANQIVAKGLQVNKNSLSVLIQQAILLKNTGNYQEAIPILERLMATNPNYSKIKLELAENYAQAGRVDQATVLYLQIIGSLEETRKRYTSGARQNTNVLAAYDAEILKSYIGFADLFFKNMRYPEAIEYYTKARSIANSGDYPYLKLAQTYLALGQTKDALNFIAGGLRINPANYELYYTRGLVSYATDDFNNAVINFNQSLQDPKLKDNSNFYLGLTHYKGRNFSEALKHFRLVNINSEFAENSLEYGSLVALHLNSPEDIRYFFSSLDRFYSNKPLKNKYEALQFTRKLFENSLDENEANYFLRNEPNNARVLYALAILNFKNSKKENAYGYLERALRTKQLYLSDIYLYPGFGQFEDRRVSRIIKDYL